jgi:hypothetical protein
MNDPWSLDTFWGRLAACRRPETDPQHRSLRYIIPCYRNRSRTRARNRLILGHGLRAITAIDPATRNMMRLDFDNWRVLRQPRARRAQAVP